MPLAFLSNKIFFIVAISFLVFCFFYSLFFIVKNNRNIQQLKEKMADRETTIEDTFYRDEVFGTSSVLGTRSYQQDRVGGVVFSEENTAGVFTVLCDGMGGLENGELASDYSEKTILNSVRRDRPNWDTISRYMRRLVQSVNNAICDISDSDGKRIKTGTTLVAAAVKDYQMYWISVGDSRIYVFQNENVKQITRDHNLEMRLKERVASGAITQEEMDREKRKDALISYIGMKEDILVDQNTEPLNLYPGEMVLLCSDGVTKLLSDGEIAEILKENRELPAGEIARKITEAATQNRRRGQDNTSAAIIKILPQEAMR